MTDRSSNPIPQPTTLGAPQTDLEVLARAMTQTQEPQVINLPEASILLHPKNMEAKVLEDFAEKYLAAPLRRKGTQAIARLPSLIAYANRWKNKSSVVLAKAEVDGNSIEASAKVVFNAHPEGPELDHTGHGDFTATYDFPVSKELQVWLEANNEPKTQVEFAEFIEDNSVDLADVRVLAASESDAYDSMIALEKRLAGKFGDPITLIELSRGLEVRVKEEVKNISRLPSGEVTLGYTTVHEGADGQPLKVPAWFIVNVPIFEGGARHAFVVRLRYRVNGGRVSFTTLIYQLRETFDQAFNMSIEMIAQETGLPVFQVA